MRQSLNIACLLSAITLFSATSHAQACEIREAQVEALKVTEVVSQETCRVRVEIQSEFRPSTVCPLHETVIEKSEVKISDTTKGCPEVGSIVGGVLVWTGAGQPIVLEQ